MTNLTHAKHNKTRDQHVETGIIRQKKDTGALKILVNWFNDNNNFNPNYPALRSLSSGITASLENNINCHDAEIVGESIQNKMDTLRIEDCKVKRAYLMPYRDGMMTP